MTKTAHHHNNLHGFTASSAELEKMGLALSLRFLSTEAEKWELKEEKRRIWLSRII
jgi:hypothetical protein